MNIFKSFFKSVFGSNDNGEPNVINKKKSNIIFIDAETNSVHKDRVALQLAWSVYSEDGKKLFSKSFILKQLDVEISPSAYKIHHISYDRMAREGRQPFVVYGEFLKDIEICDTVVGHNLRFDIKTVNNDLAILGYDSPFVDKKLCCTMEISKYYVNAKNKRGDLKNPRLEELAGLLLYGDKEKTFPKAHDAGFDVSLTVKSFFKLKELHKNGVIEWKYFKYDSKCLDGEQFPCDEVESEINIEEDLSEDIENLSEPEQEKAPKTEEKIIDMQYEKPDNKNENESKGEGTGLVFTEIDDFLKFKIYPPTAFWGRNVLITGELPNGLKREEGETMVKEMGGNVKKSVVKKLNFVVIGDNPGWSKCEQIIDRQSSGDSLICITGETFLELYNMKNLEFSSEKKSSAMEKLYVLISNVNNSVNNKAKGVFDIEELEYLRINGYIDDDIIKNQTSYSYKSSSENKKIINSDKSITEKNDKAKILYINVLAVDKENIPIFLAWRIYSNYGTLEKSVSYTIDQFDLDINDSIYEKYGLSVYDDDVMSELDIYDEFWEDLKKCDTIIGCDMKNDIHALIDDLNRWGFPNPFAEKKLYCITSITKPYIKSKDKQGNMKNPAFNEIVYYLLKMKIDEEVDFYDNLDFKTELIVLCFDEIKRLSSKSLIELKTFSCKENIDY